MLILYRATIPFTQSSVQIVPTRTNSSAIGIRYVNYANRKTFADPASGMSVPNDEKLLSDHRSTVSTFQVDIAIQCILEI
jgi:hypothetical protein